MVQQLPRSDQPPAGAGEQAVGDFAQRVMGDSASALTFLLASLGDRHELFRALAVEPATAAQLARRTGLDARYLHEWLAAMAAGRYLHYDSGTGAFSVPPAHVPVLAVDGTPASVGGVFQWLLGVAPALDAVSDAFRTGRGVPPEAYGSDLLPAMERIGSPMYNTHLVNDWLALVPRAHAQLAAGADLADIGCGSGRALVTLAQAFPSSRFTGYDAYQPQLERARANAEAAGVSDRVSFEQVCVGSPTRAGRSPNGMPAERFDLVLAFDVLHDAADPAAVLSAARAALRPNGILLCLELAGADTLADNLNPIGQIYFGVSLLYCLSVSLSSGGPGLGSLGLTGRRLAELASEAGFADVHRLTEVPPAHALYEVSR